MFQCAATTSSLLNYQYQYSSLIFVVGVTEHSWLTQHNVNNGCQNSYIFVYTVQHFTSMQHRETLQYIQHSNHSQTMHKWYE